MQLSPEQQQALDAQKAQCPFCKIIRGEIPSKKIYEDEKIIALLDINPATKGHTLVVPKEHYPILPLLPPETFLHMAVKLKEISKSIMEGVLVFGDNVFVANGMVAGQQSQHFLIHVIPREKNDGVEVFELKKNTVDPMKEEELYKVLKQNLPMMLRGAANKFPMQNQQQKASPLPAVSYSREELLSIIDKNLPLKRLLLENPTQFKQISQQNPQLQLLFKGVNIDEIIAIVRKKEFGDEQPKSQQRVEDAEIVEENKQGQMFQQVQKPIPVMQQKPIQQDVFSEMQQQFLQQNPSFLKKEQLTQERDLTPEKSKNEETEHNDEHYDYADFMQVVNNNPKLKYLLLHDLPLLKEKIATTPALAELFKDIDVEKLRQIALHREEEGQKAAFEEQIHDDNDFREKNRQKELDDEENKKNEDQKKKDAEDDLIARLG